jgi:hypothetical protein
MAVVNVGIMRVRRRSLPRVSARLPWRTWPRLCKATARSYQAPQVGYQEPQVVCGPDYEIDMWRKLGPSSQT